MSTPTVSASSDTAPDPDLLAARDRALEESGWGQGFRLWQPRNPAFWVLLLGIAAGVVSLVQIASQAARLYPVAVAVGAVAFALYGGAWWLFLRLHDRSIPRSVTMLATVFVWGGTAGTFWMAVHANDALLSLYGKLFGTAWSTAWGAAFAAPVIEEFAKATALVLILGLASHLVRSPYDGFMIGAFTGLGFQVAEDMLYAAQTSAANFGSEQIESAVQTILIRSGLGIVSHTLFSALFCAGLVWFLGRPRAERNRALGAGLMLATMTFHCLWDAADAIGNSVFGSTAYASLVLGVVIVVAIVVVRVIARRASRVQRQWLRAVLAPEVDQGVLTEPEVAAVVGDRGARRRYLRSAPHGRRQGRHVLTSVRALA
ncbi:PrsW family intramembrane metalloprotease, partial [Dietzia sp. SYD-A1]|uniref:PrsW family intramembrane metalloprotease n=2 Tax=unclassified Dietzia TaxID=2617939 RepID=UPI001891C379